VEKLAVSVSFLFVSGGFVFAAEFYLFHFFFFGRLVSFHWWGRWGRVLCGCDFTQTGRARVNNLCVILVLSVYFPLVSKFLSAFHRELYGNFGSWTMTPEKVETLIEILI
jgi:hypothetical protein